MMHSVAAILMCAGSSSRFEDGDKFLHPLTPLNTCILDLAFRRLRRNTGGMTELPIIINCNEDNIEKVQTFLKQRHYYGFAPSKIRY